MSTLNDLKDALVEGGISPASATEIVTALQAEPTIGGSGGAVATSSAETAVGLQSPGTSFTHTYSPTSTPTQTIKFAVMHRFDYVTTYSNSGAGHSGASLAWYNLPVGSGNPNYALAHEAKLTAEAGTTATLGSCYEGQMTGAGTVQTWNGVQGRITAFTGSSTYARGHYAQADLTSPATVTNWYGYYNDVKSGTGTLVNNYAFYNTDTGAVVYSAGPICDATLQYETPLTGATITMANKISSLLINPAGTIATLTITFPAVPINGQELSLSTVQTITALTLAGNGKTILQGVTTLAAGNAVVYKYYEAASLWYRVS